MLNKDVFSKLERIWGPFEVDLFTARHNAQLLRYYIFKPDPGVEAVDTLVQIWTNLRAYAFPPFVLIGRCLKKLDQDQVKELVLIVPFWHNQTWYPNLLARLVNIPLILPNFSRISLVPTPYPAFQCFTLKSGRAWYAKSRALHDVLMNVGVQTTPLTQRVSACKDSTIVDHFDSAFARARASYSCVLWKYMAPLLALRFRVFFETILPGKRESLS